MEQIEGAVWRIVFRAPDGAFAVVRLQVVGREAPVTVIGPLSDSSPGENLKVEGEWEQHPVHGAQFRATRAVIEIPRTDAGVVRYLEGLKGVGPGLAARLVAAFGVDAIEVLEKEPWRAAQIKGVGKRRAEAVGKEAGARRADREWMVFLQGLGISFAYAVRIRKTYGDQAIARVRENPYRLARDVQGIGFAVADRIARGMGIEVDSPLRIQAGVYHALHGFSEEGSVCAPERELVDRAAEALAIDEHRAREALEELVLEGAVILEEDMAFLPWLHRAEVEAVRRIRVLLDAKSRPAPLPVVDPRHPLSKGQLDAIGILGRAQVGIITGGPGTGKTTMIRTLVRSAEKGRLRVLLAAPTGRAAKRLHEATGRPAQTIHRLLEWGRQIGAALKGPFGRHAANPLEVDLLVVDEASMIDLVLFRGLVDAVPPGARLILVGDVDQLPSVGPGRVLGDLCDSGVVPVARLREVFRQAEGSGIVENAYRILAGEVPVGAPPQAGEPADFYIVHAEEPERARERVVRLCQERIPQAFGLDPLRDVQVLSPMHRGGAGTEELNRALQAALNPSGAQLENGARILRVGDKVMQIRNDYDRDVFNGDVGRVLATSGDPAGLVVDFDGRQVHYSEDGLDQLELAYAVSIHKSQGAEYPAVVVPLVMQHFVLLRRNLLYTAVTRGKRLVVLVGSEKAIRRAVEEQSAEHRHTRLAARLRNSRKEAPAA